MSDFGIQNVHVGFIGFSDNLELCHITSSFTADKNVDTYSDPILNIKICLNFYKSLLIVGSGTFSI